LFAHCLAHPLLFFYWGFFRAYYSMNEGRFFVGETILHRPEYSSIELGLGIWLKSTWNKSPSSQKIWFYRIEEKCPC
jgi:hypothetical protein